MKKVIIYLTAAIAMASCTKEGNEFSNLSGSKVEPKVFYPSASVNNELTAPNGVKFWGSHASFEKEQHYFVPINFDFNVTVPATYAIVPTSIYLKIYGVNNEEQEVFLGDQSYKIDYQALPFNDVIFGSFTNLPVQNTTIYTKYFYIPSFGDGVVYDKVFFKP